MLLKRSTKQRYDKLEKKIEFLKEYGKYRHLTVGKGREIALRAGIEYITFQNYVKGAGNDESVMESIIQAVKNILAEEQEKISLVLS